MKNSLKKCIKKSLKSYFLKNEKEIRFNAPLLRISSIYIRQRIESEASAYSGLVTESSIRAMGGPLMDPKTTSVSDWIAQLDTNLVPMDRSGDPLYYLITPHTLPELPEATAVEAAEVSVGIKTAGRPGVE